MRKLPVAICLYLMLFVSYHAHAQPIPDCLFDNDGTALINFGSSNYARNVYVMPDGRIVVGGNTTVGGIVQIALARLNPEGTPDFTFNGTGKVVIPTTSDNIFAEMQLLPNGQIWAVGISGNKFILARYLDSGLPDNSFSGNGIADIDFIPSFFAFSLSSLEIQQDGKAIMACSAIDLITSQHYIAVARINADGTPDNTFSFDGFALSPVTTQTRVSSLKIQPDGKILVGGSINIDGLNQDFILARFNTEGELDNTFGENGFVISDFKVTDKLEDMMLLPGGKILAAGAGVDGDGKTYAILARYHSTGLPDESFGSGGVTAVNLQVWPKAIAVNTDGSIVAAGVNREIYNSFAAIRYLSDGLPDNSFGHGGAYSFHAASGYFDEATDVDIQPDGKIILAGYIGESGSSMAVSRLALTGYPDINLSKDSDNYQSELSSYSFFDQAINTHSDAVFLVENLGTEPLNISSITISGTDLSLQGTLPETIPPSGSAPIIVRFAPTATDPAQGMLTLNSNDCDESEYQVELFGFSALAPEINVKQVSMDIVSNGTYNFGNKTIGTNNDVVFTIENIGTANLVINSGTFSGDGFLLATPLPANVASGETTTFTVQFTPSSATDFFGSLTIINNDSDESNYVITFTGTGIPPALPEIDIRQANLSIENGNTYNFETTTVGSNTDAIFTIENTGTANLSISGSTIVGDGFLLVAPVPTSVGAGETVTFQVRFTPPSVANFSGSMTIVNNDSDESAYTIHLTGAGIAAPTPEINIKQNTTNLTSNSTFDFGSITIETDTDVAFTIENAGTADLIISSHVLSGNAFALLETIPYHVAAGNTGTFSLRFSPTAETEYTGNILLTTNDTDEGEYMINFTGAGIQDAITGTAYYNRTSNTLVIFPNPVSDKFRVLFPDHFKEETLLIYNFSGKKIKEIDSNPIYEPDVSDLPPGIYFITTSKKVLLGKFFKK